MTSPAVLEIQIATESSLAIVTTRARFVAVRKMFERAGRSDLPLLRQPRGVVMTITATQALAPAMLRVAEREPESVRVS
jgi:hypothetical protein